MTATDELRRMLDERGVEYGGSDAVVYFEDERGYKACAYDAPRRFGEGVLCVSHTATPEQAIAATLGNDGVGRTNDGLADLQAENAKLRELVRRLISHVEHPPCEGCGFEMNCDGEHVTQCDEWLFMVADARKLGVEVDG